MSNTPVHPANRPKDRLPAEIDVAIAPAKDSPLPPLSASGDRRLPERNESMACKRYENAPGHHGQPAHARQRSGTQGHRITILPANHHENSGHYTRPPEY